MRYYENKLTGKINRETDHLASLGKILVGCLTIGVFFCAWWQLNQPSLFAWLGDAGVPAGWSLRPSSGTGSAIIANPEAITAGLSSISLKTVMLILHLVGLTLGFGSALFLDFYLLRFLFLQKVHTNTHEMVKFGSGLVAIGLMLLWVTGLGFLVLYWWVEPGKLENPKIWSKLIIVAMLSANGLVIHESLLAKIKTKVGAFLLEGEGNRTIGLFALVASVSCVSWIAALVLGIAKELNDVVDGGYLLMVYLAAIAALFLVLFVMLAYTQQPIKSARPSLGYR